MLKNLLNSNKDISHNFENISQTPEFCVKFNYFISRNIGSSQDDVDRETMEIYNILIDGARLAKPDFDKRSDMKGMKAGSRHKISKKRRSFAKWHDLSFSEVRKVSSIAMLLKSDPDKKYLWSK